MSAYDDVLTALDKLTGDNSGLKDELKGLVQSINQEKGSALTDLNGLKDKNKDLEGQLGQLSKSQTNFKVLTDALKAMKIDIKDADKLAEKLNIEKTAEDKAVQLEAIAKEASDKLKIAEKKLLGIETEKKVQPLFEKAIKEFKDKDGNEYILQPEFVNSKELFESNIDLTSDVIVESEITKVLQKGYADQEAFVERTGAVFKPKDETIHNTNTNPLGHFGAKGVKPNLKQIKENIETTGGDLDSVAAHIGALNAENQ